MEVGLDSLSTAAFLSEIASLTGLELEVSAISNYPTVRDLTHHLASCMREVEHGNEATRSSGVDSDAPRLSTRGLPDRPPTSRRPRPDQEGAASAATVTLLRQASTSASTLVLLHSILGNFNFLTGISARILTSHTVVGLSHKPTQDPSKLVTMHTLAKRYADDLVRVCGGSDTMDFLGISNGAPLAHQVALAVRYCGGSAGRLVMLDPAPPKFHHVQLPVRLCTLEAASRVLLSFHSISLSGDDERMLTQATFESEQSLFAAVSSFLLAGRVPRGTLIRETERTIRSIQQLSAAEEAFYWERDGLPVLPYEIYGHASILLILSSEEAACETRKLHSYSSELTAHGTPRSMLPGEVPIRLLFGKVAHEMVTEGGHMSVCSQICSKVGHPAANAMEAFLTVDEAGNLDWEMIDEMID